ncbi:amino acid deaminase [Microbacterium sp. 22242]|uniref:amino acid deaminase n=1 Tax=Microbacterium sp. 22242 TaxID=3453896 RepID=UPI003F87392A
MAVIDDLVHAAAEASSAIPGAAAAALDSASWLGKAIDADRAAGVFSRWGLSTVIDADAREAVISRALFEALHERAVLPATWPVGNAGVLHAYGYLLSLTPTPYGLKRERWLDGALAAALGLDPVHFLPWEGSGTLLGRVTDALSALLESGGEFSWFAPVAGRATLTVLGPERGARALGYAVAPTPGSAPLLVTLFPVAQADAVRRELDEASARLRWNAA